MSDRPRVTVQTSAGPVTLSACFAYDEPRVTAEFECLTFSRVAYKGRVIAFAARDFEVDHESVWRADRLLGDPTYKQRQRVVDFVRDALRAEAWRVLGGDVARETRRGELEREIASASEDVARLRAELVAAEAREAAARAEMAALGSAAAA